MARALHVRILIALVAICLPAFPQVCGSRSGASMQMQVQLTFGDELKDTDRSAVSNENDSLHRGDTAGVQRSQGFATNMQIHVQLQDPTAGTLQELAPGSDGQLRMMVCKNSIYRLRITGPAIEETIVDSVQPGNGDRMLTVVLHRKLTGEDRKTQPTTISATRLNVPKKARKEMKKGDAALKKGRLEEARKYYERAVEIYPQFEEAENNLGIVLMQEGKTAEGKKSFQRSVAINPRYASGYLNLAKIAFDDKRYNDAESLARQALTTEPLNPGALFLAAESAFFKGEYSDTVSYSRTLHSLPHKQYALAHFLAAKSLEAENQPAQAMTEYRMFLEEDPSDPNAARARELLMLLQASTNTSAGQDSNHQ
jgi:hypothetical protein